MLLKSFKWTCGALSITYGLTHYLNDKSNKTNALNEIIFYPILDDDKHYISKYIDRACSYAKINPNRFDIKCEPGYRVKIVGNLDDNGRATLCLPPYFLPELWKTLHSKDENFLKYHKVYPIQKNLFPVFDTFSEAPDSVTFATLSQIYVKNSFLMNREGTLVGLTCPIVYFCFSSLNIWPLISLMSGLVISKFLKSSIGEYVYLNADLYAISCLDNDKSIALKYLQDVEKCNKLVDALPLDDVGEVEPHSKIRLENLLR